MTCCFCRPGLCLRATGFSFFFHATDLQINFNSQFMMRNFWAHVPSTVLCPRYAFLLPRKPTPGVSFLCIFYTFFPIWGCNIENWGRGFNSLSLLGGPIYTLKVLAQGQKTGWEWEGRTKVGFSIIVFNLNEMCETWQTRSHSKWLIAINKIINSWVPLFSNQVYSPDVSVKKK